MEKSLSFAMRRSFFVCPAIEAIGSCLAFCFTHIPSSVPLSWPPMGGGGRVFHAHLLARCCPCCSQSIFFSLRWSCFFSYSLPTCPLPSLPHTPAVHLCMAALAHHLSLRKDTHTHTNTVLSLPCLPFLTRCTFAKQVPQQW